MVGVHFGSLQADSQPKSIGLDWGRRSVDAVLHSSNELGELLQWLCHDYAKQYRALLLISCCEIVTFQSAVHKWRFQETISRWKSRDLCWATPLGQHIQEYHKMSTSCVQSQRVWQTQSQPAHVTFSCISAYKLNLLIVNCVKPDVTFQSQIDRFSQNSLICFIIVCSNRPMPITPHDDDAHQRIFRKPVDLWLTDSIRFHTIYTLWWMEADDWWLTLTQWLIIH